MIPAAADLSETVSSTRPHIWERRMRASILLASGFERQFREISIVLQPGFEHGNDVLGYNHVTTKQRSITVLC